jgi:hypothetical protein
MFAKNQRCWGRPQGGGVSQKKVSVTVLTAGVPEMESGAAKKKGD